MSNRYTVLVGLAFVVLVAIATVGTLRDDDGGTLGLDRLEARWSLPEFAVPDAAGSVEADANVAQDNCSRAAVPCPEADRRPSACQVDVPGAIRVCDLFDRPSVISFWFAQGDECVDQQDAVSAVSERYGGRVRFLSLDIRDGRDEVRELIRTRDWRMPVGYDRDGAVASLYGVGGCPTLAYVYPGGTLQDATIGVLGEAELERRVERLLSATARAEGA